MRFMLINTLGKFLSVFGEGTFASVDLPPSKWRDLTPTP
jgi:hypothetical protein